MRRRQFILALGGAAATWPLAARAQQVGKIPRIGFMGNSTAAMEANLIGPFRDGLRELGYEAVSYTHLPMLFLKQHKRTVNHAFQYVGQHLSQGQVEHPCDMQRPKVRYHLS